MPPPRSPGGQLTQEELDTVGQWIAAGAPTDLSQDRLDQLSQGSPGKTSSNANSGAIAAGHDAGDDDRLQRWLGRLHPAAVHLPIGLLLAAALAELAYMVTGRQLFDMACRYCVVVGAMGAVPAAILGWMAGEFQSGVGSTLTIHRATGIAVVVLSLIAAVLSRSPVGQPPSPGRQAMRWLVFVNAIMVSVAGHWGGLLVHGPDYLAW